MARKSSGYRAHKQTAKSSVKPTTVNNVAPVPGIIGKKRLEAMYKAVKNRNRRIRDTVTRLSGEYTQENYLKLARAGYLPGQMVIDFSGIKSIKEYNKLMKYLNMDKSKEWKAARLDAMRNWMATMVSKSLYITPDMDPELFARIAGMSEKDILAFRKNNPEMIKDFFEWYSAPFIDGDARDTLWDEMRQSLGMKPLEEKPTMYAV